MTTRHVTRDKIDEHLRRIKREGVERLVSATPDGDTFLIVTEPRDTRQVETR